MSQEFHVDVGPFSIDVQLDDSGVRLRRGTLAGVRTEAIPWPKITGAQLVRPDKDSQARTAEEEQQIARFGGQQALQKIRDLQGKVGEIVVAYRNERNSLVQAEIPAPLVDPAFLQEFQTRLGSRWLGETNDRKQVDKKLHSNPGFFKTIFVLVALLGIVAVIAAIFLFGLLGPVLNLLSIQRMLLDLQDGNYLSLSYRILSYITLLAIGYFLHRVIRSRLDAMKMRRFRGPSLPRPSPPN